MSGEHLPSWPVPRTLIFVALKQALVLLFVEIDLSRRTKGMVDQRISSRAKQTATALGPHLVVDGVQGVHSDPNTGFNFRIK